MSRREERRALEDELEERREELEGNLRQEIELSLPPPPRAAAALRAPLPPIPEPEPAEPAEPSSVASLAGVGAPAPKRRGRPPKPRPEPEEDELSSVDSERPSPPPPPPLAVPPKLAPANPPPPPKPTSPTMSTQKDPRAISYSSEPPHELMTKHIEEGYGPAVWAEIRRLLPGGGTSTLKKNIQIPIMSWSILGERFSTLLGGGGSYIIMLSQERGQQSFVRWKESYEGPPRVIPNELTIAYDDEKQDFVIVQNHLEAMGGLGASPPNPYAGATPPLPAGGSGAAAPAFPRPTYMPDGRLVPPPEGVTQPWMRGFPAEQQWAMARDAYRQQYGVDPAANVALQWVGQQGREVEHARTQAARYEERLDATKDRSSAMLDAERTARSSLERQVAELRAQMLAKEQAAAAEKRETELRNEMKLLEMKITSARGGGTADSSESMVKLATALAPLGAAFIQHQAEMRAAEQRSRDEFNRTMLLAMTQNKGPDITGFLSAAAPIVAPVMVRWLENQDPEKRTAAQLDNAQNQMMLYKFVFDSIAQMQGGGEEPEPWYVRLLREMAPALMGMGQMAMLEAGRRASENAKELPRTAKPGDPLPPPRPGETQVLRPEDAPVAQPDPVAPPAPTTSFALDINRTVASFAEADPQAAQLLGYILEHLAKTEGAESFMRHEWATVFFHIHITPKNDADLEERAEHIAVMLADLLEHDRNFAMLPAALLSVFTEPRKALMSIIPALPAQMMNPKFVERIVDLAVEEIEMREKNRLEAEEGGEDEEGDEEGDEEEAEEEAGTGLVAASA